MAIKLPSHLCRNRYGILHFRLTVPPDLRQYFSTKEIYRSLRTASCREAIIEAQRLSVALKRLFDTLRQRDMSSDTENKPKTPKISLQALIEHAKEKMYLRERIEQLDRELEQSLDDHRRDKHHLSTLELAVRGGIQPPRPPASSGPISSYVEPYFSSFPVDQRLTPRSLDAYRAAIETFIKIVGDKPLLELSVIDRNRFEKVIVKLPANSTKLQATRSLEVDEIIKLGLPPINVLTQKNIARRTQGFLSWAFRHIDAPVPFKLLDNIKIAKKKKTAKIRREFTPEELRIVFNPATLGTSRQASPYMFWVPLIGVHSGMRINEIAQLELNDIVDQDGIPCFKVTDEPDADEEPDLIAPAKSLKTAAAKRLVPVHPRLIDLGLFDYMQALRAAGHKRLFPDLVGGTGGPGQPASKAFARYCDKIDLKDKMLVFHSFRHGAVGAMRRAGIQKELRKIVVGHSMLEDTNDEYGDIYSDYSTAEKLRAVKALNFDGVIDYIALKARTPTVVDLKRAVARNAERMQGRSESAAN